MESEPNRGAVIAPPHPLYGGSMDSPVVTEVAHACEAAGIASLRFNWRGVGASAGDVTGDEEVADADYAASLEWTR
jgi:alpha/beta superfamily hydrolase